MTSEENSILDKKVEELLETKPEVTSEIIKYTIGQVQRKNISPEVHSKKVIRKLNSLLKENE